MDKKICFAVVCALAVVYGCDDDAGLGSKVVETCTRPGETKCTTDGARVVCQDGVYVPSACVGAMWRRSRKIATGMLA